MNHTIVCGNKSLNIGRRTYIMGIVNITPDSMSDGGLYLDINDAMKHCEKLLKDGADILDIGGESTRPFAQSVSPAQEQSRVIPLIKQLVKSGINNISIDTRNASTAAQALECGASWINDVSALSHDKNMINIAKNAQAVVLMHMRGNPSNMQKGEIKYEDATCDIYNYLNKRVDFAVKNGLKKEKLIIDPGIGFGKNINHNLELTKNIAKFKDLSGTVLFGPSRKRFLGEIIKEPEPKKRDQATAAVSNIAAFLGADIIRVHNVKDICCGLKIADALKAVN